MESSLSSPRHFAALSQWRSRSALGIGLVLFGFALPAIRRSARRFERRIDEGRWDENGPISKETSSEGTTEETESQEP
jgi:hypothetical protein